MFGLPLSLTRLLLIMIEGIEDMLAVEWLATPKKNLKREAETILK